MKFIIVIAMLLAVAYTGQAASLAGVQKDLQTSLVDAGVAPEVANGWLEDVVAWIKTNVDNIASIIKSIAALGK